MYTHNDTPIEALPAVTIIVVSVEARVGDDAATRELDERHLPIHDFDLRTRCEPSDLDSVGFVKHSRTATDSVPAAEELGVTVWIQGYMLVVIGRKATTRVTCS